MEDEDIKEYEKSLLDQAYVYVIAKCLLLQAGLVLPAFLLGRAYEAHEAAWWPNMIWLVMILLASAGLLYTLIDYFRYKLNKHAALE